MCDISREVALLPRTVTATVSLRVIVGMAIANVGVEALEEWATVALWPLAAMSGVSAAQHLACQLTHVYP